MSEEYIGFIRKCCIAMLIVIAAGAAAGAAYYVNVYAGSVDIKHYLDGLLRTASEGLDAGSVTCRALKSNMFTYAVLLASGFFRFGFVTISAELARRGFISGFTSAALMRVYGAKGLMTAACRLPAALMLIPSMAAFAAAELALSLGRREAKKNIIIFYIFLSAATAAIFCGASFCDGYLTTIFMKLAAKSVT